MKIGESMLKLSKELIASLNDNSPVVTLNLESGSLELYKSHAGDLLLDSQNLNIVLRMDNSTVLGFHIRGENRVGPPKLIEFNNKATQRLSLIHI